MMGRRRPTTVARAAAVLLLVAPLAAATASPTPLEAESSKVIPGVEVPLLPTAPRVALLLILSGVVLFFAAGAGVGGGPVLVPLIAVVGGFSSTQAVALSTTTIFSASLVNAAINLPRRRHPTLDRPLVSWPLLLLLLPPAVLGAVGGALVGKMAPAVVTYGVLALLMTWLTREMLRKANKLRRSESEAMDAAAESCLTGGGSGVVMGSGGGGGGAGSRTTEDWVAFQVEEDGDEEGRHRPRRWWRRHARRGPDAVGASVVPVSSPPPPPQPQPQQPSPSPPLQRKPSRLISFIVGEPDVSFFPPPQPAREEEERRAPTLASPAASLPVPGGASPPPPPPIARARSSFNQLPAALRLQLSEEAAVAMAMAMGAAVGVGSSGGGGGAAAGVSAAATTATTPTPPSDRLPSPSFVLGSSARVARQLSLLSPEERRTQAGQLQQLALIQRERSRSRGQLQLLGRAASGGVGPVLLQRPPAALREEEEEGDEETGKAAHIQPRPETLAEALSRRAGPGAGPVPPPAADVFSEEDEDARADGGGGGAGANGTATATAAIASSTSSSLPPSPRAFAAAANTNTKNRSPNPHPRPGQPRDADARGELALMAAKDRAQLPPGALLLLAATTLSVLAASLSASLATTCGSPQYWIAQASVVPPLLLISWAGRRSLLKRTRARRKALGLPEQPAAVLAPAPPKTDRVPPWVRRGLSAAAMSLRSLGSSVGLPFAVGGGGGGASAPKRPPQRRGRSVLVGVGDALSTSPPLPAARLPSVSPKLAAQYGVEPSDLRWTSRNTLLIQAVAVPVGLLASALGLGGAALLTPLLVSLAFHPLCAAATTQTMLLETTLTGGALYATLGSVPWRYAGALAGVAVLATSAGQFSIDALLRAVGRASIIVYCLVGFFTVAGLMAYGLSATAVAAIVKRPELIHATKGLCRATGGGATATG